MLNKRRLGNRGDTIVEVMIVLAILGSAIGIAYAIANRSLLDTRQAQENSQATEYVQSQVEALLYLAPKSSTIANDDIYSPPGNTTAVYCIHDPTVAAPLTVYDSTKPTSDPASCSFGVIPYTVLIYNCDKITTSPCTSVSGQDTFLVQAQWPDVLGQGTDQVTLAYRVHQ